MSEIKQINTGVAGIIAVKVPEGAKSIDDEVFINKYGSYVRWWSVSGHDELIDLPPGNWKPLGLSTELTEEQCRDIMPMIDTDDVLAGYERFMSDKDFAKSDEVNACSSAKESFASLMQSVGAYAENPYGADKPIISDPDPYSQYHGAQMDEIAKWNEAEENTGTWLLLKRLS